MDINEKLIDICFHEFCMVVGDSPSGCDACPYGEYWASNGGCYGEYKRNKFEKLGVTILQPPKGE